MRCALATPLGEAGCFRSANIKIFAYFHISRASPIIGVQIVVPKVLAQYKSNERIGEARTPVRRTSPIVIKLAYKFRCTDQKRKYVQYETMAN
jgi:hypothetical protein